MKKKKVILACLLAAALTGCGNGNGENLPGQAPDANSRKETTAENGNKDSVAAENGQRDDAEDRAATVVEKKPESEADNMEPETVSEADEQVPVEGFVFGDTATMDNNVNGRELPIYCVDTEEKKVALSFDAAWGNEDTAELLSILEEHDLKVTFFMTGGWVESYPEDVKAILAAGHDLGNHSENHKNMSELSDEEKKEEILSVHQKVQEITGYEMFLFRPPYGDYDNALIDVLKENEYYAIQWDVDSLDWKNEGVDAILETVTGHKNLGNGSIILCHNGAEYTAEALDTLINELEAQGYEIVPISELIYKDNYHMNYEGRQIKN